jgi:hypothetical protein
MNSSGVEAQVHHVKCDKKWQKATERERERETETQNESHSEVAKAKGKGRTNAQISAFSENTHVDHVYTRFAFCPQIPNHAR